MAALTQQQVVLAGVAPTYAAASAGGDTVPPGDHSVIHVKNGSAGALTVTVDSVAPSSYGDDVDIVVSVPAGGERLIGPFPAARFANAANQVAITYSGVTSLTIASFRL